MNALDNTSEFEMAFNNTLEDMFYKDTGTTQQDDRMAFMQLCIDKLNLCFLPVIVIVGSVGNCLCLYVILASHLRHQSSNIYLAFLSFSDTGFLVCVFLTWIDFLKANTVFSRNGFCQMIPYITYVFSFLSVFTVVSFTVERFIITFHPLQRQRFCTTGRAKLVVGGLSVFALIYYSFPLYMSSVITKGEVRACMPKDIFLKPAFILSSIDTVLTLLLPFVIIIPLNIAISVKISSIFSRRNTLRLGRQFSVVSNTKNETAMSSLRTGLNSDESEGSLPRTMSLVQMNSVSSRNTSTVLNGNIQARTTRTLLILSSTFIILNFPSHILRIYAFIVSLGRVDLSQSQMKYVSMWQNLVQFIYYLNFACNFFLYSLCSKSFREAARTNIWNRVQHKIERIRMRIKGEEWNTDIEEEYSLHPKVPRSNASAERMQSFSRYSK